MMQVSIVKKLWLATALLVLLTLGVATLTQMWLLKNTYYDQQEKELLAGANEVARLLSKEEEIQDIEAEINRLAGNLHSTLLILNKEGQIIHTSGGLPGGMMHGMGRGMGMGQSGYGGLRLMLSQVDMKQILAGQHVTYQGNHPMFNMEVITVAVPIQAAKEVVGAVAAMTPLQPINANLRSLQGVSLYGLLFGLLLATVFSWLLSRSLSRPLLQMQEAARSMARGDYSKRISYTNADEIGLLAESLNTLSQELEEKITQLRQIDDNRRDFVASVSHELRTPLTIIQGNTEALLDEYVEDPINQKKYLGSVLEETLRLRRLVDELLDLRKIETGQINLYKQQIDVKELFGNVVHRMSGLAAERMVKLKLEMPEKTVLARLDADRLGQVLINLIDNALRVSPQDTEVQVKLLDRDDLFEGEISDKGPGIPEQEQPYIWDKFYKVDKSRTRAGSGTGLGLAIVKQLIELHQGKITLYSAPGEGTTFRFTLHKNSR